MRARAASLAVLLCIALAAAPRAAALSFGVAPDVPSLGTLTLNGSAQTLTATINSWTVALGLLDLGLGFNVTVGGDSSGGHSAVFRVYCPNASCGSDPSGYVSGGATLPAGSLTLSSSGAAWSSGGINLGQTPAFLCNSGCAIDVASPVKVASQATGGLISIAGTWSTSGWSSSSISLAVPTTIRAPKQSGEVYRLDLVWTLASGP